MAIHPSSTQATDEDAFMPGAVAFILKGYPRISETFIAQEIKALEKRGVSIRIISLRAPTDGAVHPVHRAIAAPITYLPEYLYQQPLRVWRACQSGFRLPGFGSALRQWLRDLKRDFTPNRARRFGQALVLARELPPDVVHFHAHFLHTPASVTRYASLLTGLPWSCSAHAKDIWISPRWEKVEKLAECRWAVTCSAVNHAHLKELTPHRHRIELIYHGLDPTSFPAADRAPSTRDGRASGDPVVILSVGRAVEKKGYDDVLDALALLPARLQWRFVHVGDGVLLERLQRRARARGIQDRLTWLGAQPQDIVLSQYRQADVFVLASRVARNGDRDGLPNVLLEAQSQGLACLATRAAAIPELIEDGVTGLLSAEADKTALAEGLQRLMTDPALRERLGSAGRARVRERFPLDAGIDRLAAKFELAIHPGEL